MLRYYLGRFRSAYEMWNQQQAGLAAASELFTLTRDALTANAIARELDGRKGLNRCRSPANQLGEDVNDVAAVFFWIRNRANSEKTRRVFLSEVRRLYYWIFMKAKKPLSSLTLADFVAYREFLKAPPKDWMGPKVPYLDKNGLISKAWRPFEKPLTDSHVRHVFAVLKSLFKYLTEVSYLNGSTLAGMRVDEKTEMGDDRARKRRVTERALDKGQWNAVLAAVETFPVETAQERAHYERARFIVRLFYHLGARITEATRHHMGDFVKVNDRWKWSIVDKSGKHREIIINSELLEALQRYRTHLNTLRPDLQLTPLPLPGEKFAVLYDVQGKKALSTRQLFDVVKKIFAIAAKQYEAVDKYKAAALRNASPRWIRHATASHLANRATTVSDLWKVQEHMRHSTLDTTLAYTHVDDDETDAIAEHLTGKTAT